MRDLRRLVPEIAAADVHRAGSGVRAQALDAKGGLLDDFRIVRGERAIHVLNAPSPRRHRLDPDRPADRGDGGRVGLM